MRRDFAFVAGWWALLTLVGEFWVARTEFNPTGYTREAETIDSSFQTLMVLGMPVLAFVVAALTYSIWRFRSRGTPETDGLPLHGSRRFTSAWLAVTGCLAALVIVHPGITGMLELRHGHAADMVVEVSSGRWYWRVHYPEYGVTSTTELVVPVDQRIEFQVTSADVVHSFWIPGFRVKIDAVPGMVTRTHATPIRLGTWEQDAGLRIQCAEMCGTGHYLMQMPVRVVTRAEFEDWIAQQRAGQ